MFRPLKIVFFGSPEPAARILCSLIDSNHEIVSVITQPDKRRSRGKELIPTPVKRTALENGINVLEPAGKAELSETVISQKADVGIVVAYGRILPKSVLDHFKYGCINVHYSMLPHLRGAAPVERAILEGDESTGVSIMQMDEGLDTGDVFVSRGVAINDKTTTETLFEALNDIAVDLLSIVLEDIESHSPYPQVGKPSYASKLSPNDFYFDMNSSVLELDRKVRAGSLQKGAWTTLNEERIRIFEVSTIKKSTVDPKEIGFVDKHGQLKLKDGSLFIDKIQSPGKKVMSFKDWANGLGPSSFPLQLSN